MNNNELAINVAKTPTSFLNGKAETRIFVKILFSEKGGRALAEVYYFKNEMTVEFFIKWEWYFEYRAALLRVKFPKAFIKLESGSYVYVLPEIEYINKVRNNYLSKKRQLTKLENKLCSIRKNWNEIFPIENHSEWIKVVKKIEWYQKQYDSAKKEYDSIFPIQLQNMESGE